MAKAWNCISGILIFTLSWCFRVFRWIECLRRVLRKKHKTTDLYFHFAKITTDETVFGLSSEARNCHQKALHLRELLERVVYSFELKWVSRILSLEHIANFPRKAQIQKAMLKIPADFKRIFTSFELLVRNQNRYARTSVLRKYGISTGNTTGGD